MWGDGPGWGMMGDWGGWWMGPFVMILFWLIVLALAGAAIAWFVRANRYRSGSDNSRSREILEERYARGEINREEYLQKKADLSR